MPNALCSININNVYIIIIYKQQIIIILTFIKFVNNEVLQMVVGSLDEDFYKENGTLAHASLVNCIFY